MYRLENLFIKSLRRRIAVPMRRVDNKSVHIELVEMCTDLCASTGSARTGEYIQESFLRSLVLFFAVMLLVACEQKLPSPFKADDVTANYAQTDFHLNDHTGKARTLTDFRGKVVAIFFGYTHCPDVCPTTLADMSLVLEKLGKDAERVQVLFITVDPERDTPELLSHYAPAFNPTFLSLYGDMRATEEVAKAFNVKYEKQPTSSGYNVDHSAGTFLIDPKGRVRLLAPYGQRPEWLVEDIRLLLAGV